MTGDPAQEDDWADQDLLTNEEARKRIEIEIEAERARIASLTEDLVAGERPGHPSRSEFQRLVNAARVRLQALEDRLHEHHLGKR